MELDDAGMSLVDPLELPSVGAVAVPVFFESKSLLVASASVEPLLPALSQPEAGLSVDLRRSPSGCGGCSPFGFLVFLDFFAGFSAGFSVDASLAGLTGS